MGGGTDRKGSIRPLFRVRLQGSDIAPQQLALVTYGNDGVAIFTTEHAQ